VSDAFADTVGDWDDFDWGWKEDEQEAESGETELECWLQECHISMSPVGDMIAVANGDRIVHFTREYTGDVCVCVFDDLLICFGTGHFDGQMGGQTEMP